MRVRCLVSEESLYKTGQFTVPDTGKVYDRFVKPDKETLSVYEDGLKPTWPPPKPLNPEL